VPHITSAYLLAVGKTLGLRGVAAAGADANAPDLAEGMAEKVTASIREAFETSEVVKALVADVNQQSASAERVIGRDVLGKFTKQSAIS
jgi:hypothetical protein